MHKDTQQNLKQDIDLLGRILGKVILKQNDQFYFDTIEKIRGLSKQTRSKNRIASLEKMDDISDILKGLTPAQSIIVARAFGHFLNLVNIAETVHEPDVLASSQEVIDVFEKIRQSNKSNQEIQKAIENLEIDLVLTAHPTEVKRRTLIQKYTEVAEVLKERGRANVFNTNCSIK
tara:strand:- start:21 stop:545 length:525 start_codon:yes stop_codon:yes gene_type:complete